MEKKIVIKEPEDTKNIDWLLNYDKTKETERSLMVSEHNIKNGEN